MTANPPTLMDAARQGNPQAIAQLMNRSLESQGVSAKVSRHHHSLSILLEATQTPNQEQCFQFVYNGITKLGITSIQVVKVYGRHQGSDFPDWHQEFNLNQATAPDATQIVVRHQGGMIQPAAKSYPPKIITPAQPTKTGRLWVIILASLAALSVVSLAAIGAWVVSNRSAQARAVKQATETLNAIQPIAAHAKLDDLKADQKQLENDQKKLQAAIEQLNTVPRLVAFNLPTVEVQREKVQTQLAALEKTEQAVEQQVKGLEKLLPFVQDAVDKFSAINSSLDVGMNYREYGQQVRELKVALDRLERQPGAEQQPAYEELALAFKEYNFAHEVWRYYIESDETHYFISTDSPYAEKLVSEYEADVRLIVGRPYIYLKDAVAIIWQRASRHVKAAQKPA